jgi:DNA invertase Pin-like site-specific DNA recombinase
LASENTPQRAAIYARISADPDGNAVGVTDQAVQCRQFIAERKRWTVTGPACQCKACKRFEIPPDVYCDNDISASGKKDRPHYQRLLDDISAGRVDVVVTSDTDRLHRSPLELEHYISICEPRQVATHTIKKGAVDLTNSTGRMVARMLGAAARHEWERMVERQLNAKRRNRESGIRQGGSRPFGYQLDVRDERGRQIPGVSKGLIKDEREAAAVDDAFARFLAGESLLAIARHLNEQGFRTPQAGKRGGHIWISLTVRRMLRRALYAGFVEIGEEVTGRAEWEPIVSEDTWRAAKAILDAPGRTTSPGPKPRNLLTGVLICGVCNSRYFRSGKASNKRGGARVYACNPRDPRYSGQAHVVRDAAHLDAYVEAVIIERLSRPDVVAALNARPGVDIAGLEGRRNGLRARLDELGALFAAGEVDGLQLAAASRPLRAQIAEAEQALSDAYRGTVLEEFAGGADAEKVWDGLPIERKRAVAKLLLRVILKPKSGGQDKGRDREGLREDLIEITSPDGTPWGSAS